MNRIIFCVLIMLVTGFISQLTAKPLDSLRLEYINGEAFVIHQVDNGETLYSISKRYGASMNAIAQATPEVKKGLHDGMILNVPYNPNKKPAAPQQKEHIVQQGETLYSISQIYKISVVEIMEWNDLLSSDLEIGKALTIKGQAAAPPPADYILDGMKIHVVQAGEGLYAIARTYEVSVDDLVEWNELTSSALNLGQELIVNKLGSEAAPILAEEPVKEKDDIVIETGAAVIAVVEEEPEQNEVEEVSANELAPPVPMMARKENGLAAGIEGESDEQLFLAMHREIPVGSLVAVRNEMNSQVVFVRIVGKLPDTGVNEKIIIRLSGAAVKQLNALDPKFRVEVNYLVPKTNN